MTKIQFEELMAAQLAQIALLQSIETNIGALVEVENPKQRVNINWASAQVHLASAMMERAPLQDEKPGDPAALIKLAAKLREHGAS